MEASCRCRRRPLLTARASRRQNGEGVDRPLLGMRMLAARMGMKPHAMFTDPAFSLSNTWRLSTSHLGSKSTKVRTGA